MSGFSQPWWLAAAALWALAMIFLAWWQKAPLEWIRERVAERFRRRLTRYCVPSARLRRDVPSARLRRDVPSARLRRDLRRARWHFVFLFALGAALIAAAAGPFVVAAGEREIESRTVLIVLDASLSMGATDVEPHPGPKRRAEGAQTQQQPASRFDHATAFAAELIEAMPDAAFGLISFSGVTVVHAPPTRDRSALATVLETITYHVDLTLSGTRYSSACGAVIHIAQHQRGS